MLQGKEAHFKEQVKITRLMKSKIGPGSVRSSVKSWFRQITSGIIVPSSVKGKVCQLLLTSGLVHIR